MAMVREVHGQNVGRIEGIPLYQTALGDDRGGKRESRPGLTVDIT